jgi:hypothetical protein
MYAVLLTCHVFFLFAQDFVKNARAMQLLHNGALMQVNQAGRGSTDILIWSGCWLPPGSEVLGVNQFAAGPRQLDLRHCNVCGQPMGALSVAELVLQEVTRRAFTLKWLGLFSQAGKD